MQMHSQIPTNTSTKTVWNTRYPLIFSIEFQIHNPMPGKLVLKAYKHCEKHIEQGKEHSCNVVWTGAFYDLFDRYQPINFKGMFWLEQEGFYSGSRWWPYILAHYNFCRWYDIMSKNGNFLLLMHGQYFKVACVSDHSLSLHAAWCQQTWGAALDDRQAKKKGGL